ncbi:MAG TPA: branched-chain amino acid ABC transporter permease [Spirochaetota bacterium]|nr:branched-chain amino acid ABC transporter permease [Spirochaetota bacterium]HOM38494.1 branched-chain amino acid ABC transporter permease [Spirochaetota bacterium]HPQ49034.1 branched-chain amino acid ABC transporter permease [Spirochaetota bacterium]
MNTFIQVLVNGILQSGTYMITTLGLALAVGVVGILNLAHGEFLMVGAFLSIIFYTVFGIDPLISILIVSLLILLLGIGTYKISLKKVLDSAEVNQLLLTFGISIILQNIAVLYSGSKEVMVINPPYRDLSWNIEGIGISFSKTLVFIIALILVITLFYILNNTKVGKSMRAVEQNRYGAYIVGINADRIFKIAFGVSVGLAGLAGVMLSIILYATPFIGFNYTLKAFAIIMMAGMGNLRGILWSSLILGIIESALGTYVPGGTGWSEGIFFFIILIILLVKPEGIFKK